MNLRTLMENEYVWFGLAFCTVASFAFAIYAWVKGKRRKELSYVSNTYRVIQDGENAIPEVDIRYKKRRIKNFVITKYAIWNSGTEVINAEDLVKTKTLKIISVNPDTAILDATVLMCNETANKISITDIQDNGIEVSFDYMEPRNGCVLQIIYTGKREDLEVALKIKGGNVKQIDTELTKQKFERKIEKRTILLAIVNIAILVMMQIFPWDLLDGIVIKRNIRSVMFNTLMIVFFGLIIYVKIFGTIIKKKGNFDGIPPKLEEFI